MFLRMFGWISFLFMSRLYSFIITDPIIGSIGEAQPE
jgi:hypothetical protein